MSGSERIALSEGYHFDQAYFDEYDDLILWASEDEVRQLIETLQIVVEGREYHDPSDRQPDDLGDVDDRLDEILGGESA